MNSKIFFHKLFHWEYWPTFMFYIPNLPLAFYLAIKAKHPVFFTAVNPSIQNSGNGLESKFATLDLIPKKYRPNSILVKPKVNFQTVLQSIHSKKIVFPLIAKPDIGFKGLLVKKIDTENDLKTYLKKYPIDIIIQEFIQYPNECGIFYYRIPGDKTGTITSITLKKFLTITGDGVSTIAQIILSDKRARIYYKILTDIQKSNMNSVPNKNEKITLTVIGNHSKGTQFIDGNHLISPLLTQMIDKLNNQIEGWFYGRIDLKYESFELLENGKEFKIIEINGIISEPTHIYDISKNSYFDAVRAIGKHWKIIYKIGTKNHNLYGLKYSGALDFLKEMKTLKRYTKKIKKLSL